MDSNPRKRGKQIADRNNLDSARDLIFWLGARGYALDEGAQSGIFDYMLMAFHRGIERGRKLQRREWR